MEKSNSLANKIFSKKWMPPLIIAVLGFLLYGRTLFFGYTYLDDNNLILGNQYFLANIVNIFQSFLIDVFHLFNSSAFYYRPLLTISFIFDYQIGGVYPFTYHLTNVVLHIAASYLFFIFLTKLNYRKPISFIFALIFLVHPVLTQAVAWIPGRNDSLLAVFVLSTFILFINYLKNEKVKNLVWSLILFALALFTKESAVLAIPMMLFYICFIYKEKKLSLNKFYFFIGSIAPICIWAILRHFVLNGSPTTSLFDMLKSIFFNFPAVIQFIGKIFLPFNLSVLPIMQDTTFSYGIISIIFLTVILIFTKTKRWNYILFGFGWFFAFLLPSFIRPNTALVADFIEHRLYVPIIGIFIILLETDLFKKIDIKKKSTLIVVGCLILTLGTMEIIYARNFANRMSFWKNAALNSPHYPLALRNLGAMEYLDGDMINAEQQFKAALELNPEENMAHNNLGLIYAGQDKLKEAEAEYKKEIGLNPYYDDVYYNLALLYWKEEKYGEAVKNFETVLKLNPNHIDAIKALAIYYYNQKDFTRAAFYNNELLRKGL